MAETPGQGAEACCVPRQKGMKVAYGQRRQQGALHPECMHDISL